jgi:hypothetical protein
MSEHRLVGEARQLDTATYEVSSAVFYLSKVEGKEAEEVADALRVLLARLQDMRRKKREEER